MAVSQTNEQALEATIEKHLTGSTLEELRGAADSPIGDDFSDIRLNYSRGNYEQGFAADFNPQYAIDTRYFWQFLESTQAVELEKIKRYSPHDWKAKILERFDRLIKRHGIIHMLKKGLAIDNAHFYLMYPAPLASSSERVIQNFAANIFSCTRQVRYSLQNPLQEIDMVLFINGIALVTLELKNPWTGRANYLD